MQEFGKGLRESVCEGGGHDGAVVVVVRLGEPLAELLAAEPGGHGEHADVVPDAALPGRHEVRDALALRLRPPLHPPDGDLLLSDSVQGPTVTERETTHTDIH